ncbi:MAG: endonuclease/exonuclease/phosphatase family protein [Chitinophagales bacterium]
MPLITFLLIAIFSISLNDCKAQDTAYFNDYTEVVPENELRILSWNIQMLPRLILRVRRGPIRRSRLIPQHIIDDKIDIIVFQEAFDRRCRRILKRRLKEEYPYHAGPANKNFGIRTNSGAMIFSKYPIKELGKINFSVCEGIDCYAHKGALLVEIEAKGKQIQVLGTHLQAGGSDSTKMSEYRELAELTEKHRTEGIPLFLCGDFNTNKKDPELYPEMLGTLDALDGPISGNLKFTSDELRNDMCGDGNPDKLKQKVIDYILFQSNDWQPDYMERNIRQYRERWSKDHMDLSDHNAVLMKIRY